MSDSRAWKIVEGYKLQLRANPQLRYQEGYRYLNGQVDIWTTPLPSALTFPLAWPVLSKSRATELLFHSSLSDLPLKLRFLPPKPPAAGYQFHLLSLNYLFMFPRVCPL